MNNWIKVTDRLPENATYHLTYNNQMVTISVWNHEYWKSLSGNIITDVTHWMPLPQSPTE
jgi:hypothetical protein